MTDGTPDEPGGYDMSGVWRLIDEVQRLGFETARSVSARFAEMADSTLGGDTNPAETVMAAWQTMMEQATNEEARQQFVAAAQGFGDAFVGMWQVAWKMFTDSSAQMGLGAARPRSATADLGAIAPGATAAGTVYVHVGTGAGGVVALRAGVLATGSDQTIAADAISLDPQEIENPSPGRSYPVRVSIAVPRDAAPGHYRGFLYARTDPESAVAMSVEVTGS